jgi:RNA polymerase sigma factor (sigma-70 family)
VRPARDAASDYRRLLVRLVSRARRLGSRDPEGAAQEALRRSLENAGSQPAIEYYFSADLPVGATAPEWPLDQLFAWLHAVLHNVVREEQSRAGYRREVHVDGMGLERDATDPAPDQLDILLQTELHGMVMDCFPKLDRDYRTVLKMRLDGLAYAEIASRLGVNENTVSTWISRGIRALGWCVRKRSERLIGPPRGAGR